MELLKKLRINAGTPVWLINTPDDCLAYFGGLEVRHKPGREKPLGQLVLFVYGSTELAGCLHRLSEYISHDTLFWICYPKKSGAYTSDLILMKSWEMVFQAGYRGQTSVSIDGNWSALRVTNAPRKKPSDCDVPMAERKADGIDYANRTVTLPPDAEEALTKHNGLTEYFYAQSFTCKREHIAAINDAKKEDTRRRRIEKMTTMLLEKMQAKAVRKKAVK